jgi:hypothetical protein
MPRRSRGIGARELSQWPSSSKAKSKFRGTSLVEAINRRSVEALVTTAYLHLARVSWDQNRSRSASLAKYENYEVRLVELLPGGIPDAPFLWIELQEVGGQTSFDSFGCNDLEAAVLAAEDIISQAKNLAEEKGIARA